MFPFPTDEFQRYDALPEYEIIGASLSDEYANIVDLAGEVLGFPIACFCILDIAELTIVASRGFEPRSIPRDVTFCAHTIASDGPLIISDLTTDHRFFDNSFVVNDPHVRFYAGITIRSREGVGLGTLCLMDRASRELDNTAVDLLERFAENIADRLEMRRLHLRDKRKLASKLHDSEELCRTALDLAQLVPWRANARGRVVDIGQGWERLTGISSNDLLNLSWINHIHPDDVETFFAMWRQTLRTGEPFEAEMRLQTSEQTFLWCRTRATPARDERNRITGWYGLIENIEEKREAATQLRTIQAERTQLSRLSAMETMASTLAHELNQPLTAIAQYVRGSQRMIGKLDHPQSAAIIEALDEAAAGALRAGEIVRSVRDLADRGEVQRQRRSVESIITEAVRVMSISLDADEIEHRIEVAPDVCSVLVDPVQVQQVLINLLRNAAQALCDMPERIIVVSAEHVADDRCAVTVSDTGPGIPEEIAARLFSPFNTSKADGLGIGLSISRTIIEAHDGQITASPRDGGGTAFRFTLPAG